MAAPIMEVEEGSIAEDLGLEPGDTLLSISGWPVDDVLDYQFACQDDEITLEVRKRNGELWFDWNNSRVHFISTIN